jgi:hypothetical protein
MVSFQHDASVCESAFCMSLRAQWIMDRKNNGHTVLCWLDVLSRWSISTVFLFAAVPKLFDIHGFAAVIKAYAILPEILLLPTALLLPVIEIVLAVGLLFNHWQCKIGTAVMLLCFIVLLSYSIRQGLDIDCGCFGPEEPEHEAFHGLRAALVRDIVLLVPLVYSFWYHQYRQLKIIADPQRVS